MTNFFYGIAVACLVNTFLLFHIYNHPERPEISIEYTQAVSSADIRSINCMAQAVYHEARGESHIGKTAVAHVVQNRARSGIYPSDTCGVVFQPDQFTDIDGLQIRDLRAWQDAMEIALNVWSGESEDPTGGSMWYYAHNKIKRPHWAKGMVVTAQIENHTFLGGK